MYNDSNSANKGIDLADGPFLGNGAFLISPLTVNGSLTVQFKPKGISKGQSCFSSLLNKTEGL